MTTSDIQFLILFAPTMALLFYGVWDDWKRNKLNKGKR